jgi:hypothetical protein
MNFAFRSLATFVSSISKMSRRRLNTLDISPPVHRGMAPLLQRDAFHKSLKVLAASVLPEKTGGILKAELLRGLVSYLSKILVLVNLCRC